MMYPTAIEFDVAKQLAQSLRKEINKNQGKLQKLESINPCIKTSVETTNQNFKILLSGSHRTGKTTLAKVLSEKLGITYLDINVSKVFNDCSLESSIHLTFGERIEVQKRIAERFENMLIKASKDNTQFVCDRSPLDLIGYLLANIDSTTSSLFDRQVKDLILSCVDMVKFFTTHVVHVPLAIDFAEEYGKSGKVYNSLAYRESVNKIILGTSLEYKDDFDLYERKMIYIPKTCVDLLDRVNFIVSNLK